MKTYNYYALDNYGTHMGSIVAKNAEEALQKVYKMYPYTKQEHTSVWE